LVNPVSGTQNAGRRKRAEGESSKLNFFAKIMSGKQRHEQTGGHLSAQKTQGYIKLIFIIQLTICELYMFSFYA
jgi:hypothetical protein